MRHVFYVFGLSQRRLEFVLGLYNVLRLLKGDSTSAFLNKSSPGWLL